jgi:dihydropteroate synthase
VNCKFPARASFIVPLPSGAALTLGERCLVMGILNVTPDSFAERERRVDPAAAVDVALAMEAGGADIIDVGGESTRPGADTVSEEDELARVLPVIAALARRLRGPVSIDTTKAAVARAAVDAGASIVNDVSGFRRDPALTRVVADTGAAVILMHMRGTPATMGSHADYGDVVEDVGRELRESMTLGRAAGVRDDRVVLDPGIGFAKRAAHSYGVLARLPELASALGRPLLVGPSRKSFMSGALDGRPAVERDWGTAAAVTAAVLAGAHIVRVHAVAEMAQVVRVAEEIRRHQP